MKNWMRLFLAIVISISTFGNIRADDAKPIEEYLRRAERNGFSGSVLVSQKGQILLDGGFGFADREAKKPQTRETIFSIGSITKQFTAAAIMRLVADGKLNVTDKLSDHFTSVPPDKKDITLHQLLTHTAGFRGSLGDDYDTLSAERYAALAFSSKLESRPGTEYNYSNVGYSLLGIIVEKVSGMGYERFLRERFFVPTGMMHTGYVIPGFKAADLAVGYRDGQRWGTALDRPWLADGPGWNLRANGGILSTAGDMYKWVRALKYATVLPEESVRQLWTPHVKEGPDAQSWYGYGWVSEGEGTERIVWHNGGNGVYNAFIGYNPDSDFFVFISSNSNDKISDRLADHVQLIIDRKFQPIEQATIDTFSGTYRLPSGSSFALRIDENNALKATFSDRQVAELMLADGTEKRDEIDAVEQQTLDLVQSSHSGRFETMAGALGMSIGQAREQAEAFWKGQWAAYGDVKSIDPVVTVARAKRGLILSFMKIVYEKSTRYIMYVWKGNELSDIRPMSEMDKIFEHSQELTFDAPTNNLSIRLAKDPQGNPLVFIKPQQREEITSTMMKN